MVTKWVTWGHVTVAQSWAFNEYRGIVQSLQKDMYADCSSSTLHALQAYKLALYAAGNVIIFYNL